jgi:hypothetical protein
MRQEVLQRPKPPWELPPVRNLGAPDCLVLLRRRAVIDVEDVSGHRAREKGRACVCAREREKIGGGGSARENEEVMK